MTESVTLGLGLPESRSRSGPCGAPSGPAPLRAQGGAATRWAWCRDGYPDLPAARSRSILRTSCR